MPNYSVAQIGSTENGYATEISLTVLPDGTVAATVTRDQHGDAALTLWNLLPGGSIHQAGQVSADQEAHAVITAPAAGTYVTAGEAF